MFGSDIKPNINFGEKYKFVPKEGPSPGEYDLNYSQTHPKSKGVYIEPEQPRMYSLNESAELPNNYSFNESKRSIPSPTKLPSTKMNSK